VISAGWLFCTLCLRVKRSITQTISKFYGYDYGDYAYPVHQVIRLFLQGTLKDTVYREPPTTIENMKEQILETYNRLSSETIQNAVSSLINRLDQ